MVGFLVDEKMLAMTKSRLTKSDLVCHTGLSAALIPGGGGGT